MIQSSRRARRGKVEEGEEPTETTGLEVTIGVGRKRTSTVEKTAEVVEEEVGVPKRMTRAMSASLSLKPSAKAPKSTQPKFNASKSTAPFKALQTLEQHPSDQPSEFEGSASDALNADDYLDPHGRLSPTTKQVTRNVSPRGKREKQEKVEVEVEVRRLFGSASRKRKVEEMQRKKNERNKGMGKGKGMEEEPSPAPPTPPVAPTPVESKGKMTRSKGKLPEPVVEEPEEEDTPEAEEEVPPPPQEEERPLQEQDNADEEEEIDQLQSSDSDGEGLVMQPESRKKSKARIKTYGKKRTTVVEKAQKTVAKKRTPMKAKTPTQSKSPAKTQTSTRAKTPLKAKRPAKPATSVQASSSTRTKVPRTSARKQPARSSQAEPAVDQAEPSDDTDDTDDDDADVEYDEYNSLEIDRPDDPKRPYSFMHVVPQTRGRKEPDWEADCIWLYPKKWEPGRLERMKQKIEENGGKVVKDLGEATIALFPPVEPLRYNKAVIEALGKHVTPLRSCWVTDSLKLSRRHDVAYRCSLADNQGWCIRPLPPQKARTILQKIDSNSPLRSRTDFTREEVEAFARFRSQFGKLERYKKGVTESAMIRSFMNKHRTPHTFESWKNFYKVVNNRERVDRLAAQIRKEERQGGRGRQGKGRGRGERRGSLTGWLEAEKGGTEEGEQEENEIVEDDEEREDQPAEEYLVQQGRVEESDREPSPKKRRKTNEPTTPKASPSKDRSPTKNASPSKLRSSPRKGLQTTPLWMRARDKVQTQASQGRKSQAPPPSSKRSRGPVLTRIVDYTSSEEEEEEEELPVASLSKKPTSSNPELPAPPQSSQFVPEAFAFRAKKFNVPPSTVEAFWFSCTSDWYLVDRLIPRYTGRSPSHTEFNANSSGFESNLWRRREDVALERRLSLGTDKTEEECMTRRQFLKDMDRYRGLFKYFDEI